jgi:hypothetical protein
MISNQKTTITDIKGNRTKHLQTRPIPHRSGALLPVGPATLCQHFMSALYVSTLAPFQQQEPVAQHPPKVVPFRPVVAAEVGQKLLFLPIGRVLKVEDGADTGNIPQLRHEYPPSLGLMENEREQEEVE